jgi:hypothetical protein
MINVTAGTAAGREKWTLAGGKRMNISFRDVHPGFLLGSFFGANRGPDDRCPF